MINQRVNCNSPLVGEGFSLITPSIFRRYPTRVPRVPGVYALFLAEGNRILADSGYFQTGRRPPWKIKNFVHVYTGEAGNINARIEQHISAKAERSGFRITLLAMKASTSFHDCRTAKPLRWLDERTRSNFDQDLLIAFKPCELIQEVEHEIIKRSGSALNIRNREADQFSRKLVELRRAIKRNLAAEERSMLLA